jgi:hypothetical protein
VVESSLGVPTGCAGKLRWQIAGMFGDATMAEPWGGMGEATIAKPISTRGGFWVGAMLTLAVKPQWVRYKLDETIEQSCGDFLAHTSEVCKGAHRYNEYSAIQG